MPNWLAMPCNFSMSMSLMKRKPYQRSVKGKAESSGDGGGTENFGLSTGDFFPNLHSMKHSGKAGKAAFKMILITLIVLVALLAAGVLGWLISTAIVAVWSFIAAV